MDWHNEITLGSPSIISNFQGAPFPMKIYIVYMLHSHGEFFAWAWRLFKPFVLTTSLWKFVNSSDNDSSISYDIPLKVVNFSDNDSSIGLNRTCLSSKEVVWLQIGIYLANSLSVEEWKDAFWNLSFKSFLFKKNIVTSIFLISYVSQFSSNSLPLNLSSIQYIWIQFNSIRKQCYFIFIFELKFNFHKINSIFSSTDHH
jgi:hypothetical protein